VTVVHRLRLWLALGAAALSLHLMPVTAGAQGTGVAATAPAIAQQEGRAEARGLVVPAQSVTEGVVVLRGDVDVFGTVQGDVLAVRGDVVVHPGARVIGDAGSVLGTVRVLPGGQVAGTAQSYAQAPPRLLGVGGAETPDSPLRGLTLTLGWLAILLLIGIGVLVSGSTYLDGVAETLQAGVGRSLAAGLAGQLLLLPALVTLIVLLAVTIVGILAIPLGIVAFVLATAGLLTLGFLAVAFVTGRAIAGGPAGWRATAARGAALRALTIGLAVYLVLWFATAALQAVPVLALMLRVVALGLTWVAVTAGFGATLLSRAGTRAPGRIAPRPSGRSAVGTMPVEREGVPVWQTPTPIGGIVAARRPTAVPSRE
jgi:hypothetical protein